MGKSQGVPDWAARHFGDQAEEVSRRVVAAMVKAQKASFEVQAFASGEGATNRRPYGSMWESRYTFLEDEMKGLDGYETFHPPGASFRLVRLNGCLLLPIRHASSLSKPLSQVHIPDGIPLQVAQMRGVRPPATLFDGLSDALALGGVAAAGEEADLVEEGPVICIAVVVNAETQQPLGLWWGEVESMDNDGLIEWTPRVLSQELAQHSVSDATDVRRLNVVEQPKVAGFSDGAEPPLAVNPRQGVNYNPQAEAEPPADHANIEDE